MIEKRFRAMRLAAVLILGITAGCTFPSNSSSNTVSKGASCQKGVEGLVVPNARTIGGFTNYLGNGDWSATQCGPFPSKWLRLESTDPKKLSQLLKAADQVCGVLDKKELSDNSLDVTTGKENCLLLLSLQ